MSDYWLLIIYISFKKLHYRKQTIISMSAKFKICTVNIKYHNDDEKVTKFFEENSKLRSKLGKSVA